MLNIAIRAARTAGDTIVRYVERVDTLEVSSKGYNDFVSEVDREAERRIVEVIRKAYPQHSVLGEESGSHAGNEYVWVVDPLDGTTNFLHGFPQYAVSIAIRCRGRLEQAVIYDPLRQELFTASRGEGARLNDRRIRVIKCNTLKSALLGTGFPFRTVSNVDTYLAILRTFIIRTSGVRRAGAAALDLAYVAAGRLDGFWEFGLKEWDMAAGVLLIQEAGGLVSDVTGDDGYFDTGNIVGGNPKVFTASLRIIQQQLNSCAPD